jgi:hypothetical protein
VQGAALQAEALKAAVLQAAGLQAAAPPYLEAPAVGVRQAVSPERRAVLGTARAKPVLVAKAKAVILDQVAVAGIGRYRCSVVETARSHAEVPLHFSVFLIFSWGEERYRVIARAVTRAVALAVARAVIARAVLAAAFERLWRRRRGRRT